MREGEQPIDGERFQQEGNEHRVLAADLVRDPAKDRSRDPVHHTVERQRECERRQRQPQDRHGHLVDVEVFGDLSPGDQIVVSGTDELRAGTRVNAKPAPASK